MTRRAKVMVLAREHLTAMLRGEGKAHNLPPDFVIVAEVPNDNPKANGIAFRVHSERFDIVPAGVPLPVVQVVLERKA